MTATIGRLAADLAAGRTTAAELVEDRLRRIADPDGEGARTYGGVDADGAREAARAMDALRRAGAEPSPLAGIPVSAKDLFDVRGQVTRAGSRALDRGPAERDATAVARWRRAGLILIGRTNMTEFAFSGHGVNPHYGTWDRARRRIPGGSSSGAAVSLTDGMAHGALGTDTGGSCRIPAALCGLVGYKPTHRQVPRDGMISLSAPLDAVGVLGRNVACCAALAAILRDAEPTAPAGLTRPPRLARPRTYLLDDAEPAVQAAFERVSSRLSEQGADVVDVDVPELAEIPEMSAGGGFPAAEAFAYNRELIAQRADAYDPRALARIRRGERQTAGDLIDLMRWRASFTDRVRQQLDGFNAVISPTVPLAAPPLSALDDDDEYTRTNLLMLRNPTVVNLLDGCAVSVPMHASGEPPSRLMVAGFACHDEQVLRIASGIEEPT